MQARPTISLRSYGDAVRHHRHAFHQFVLPLHGVLELDTPAGERPVGADTAVLIPAGTAHSFRARGDNRFAVVDVGGERPLPDHARDEPAFPVSAALRHQLTLLGSRARDGAAALTETGRAITDIALDSGFSEHSAFTRAFRRVYGISPSAYRRRYCLHRH